MFPSPYLEKATESCALSTCLSREAPVEAASSSVLWLVGTDRHREQVSPALGAVSVSLGRWAVTPAWHQPCATEPCVCVYSFCALPASLLLWDFGARISLLCEAQLVKREARDRWYYQLIFLIHSTDYIQGKKQSQTNLGPLRCQVLMTSSYWLSMVKQPRMMLFISQCRTFLRLPFLSAYQPCCLV